MGCASSTYHSKNSRCRHCKTPYAPLTKRSFSMNPNHPFLNKTESYHMVGPTSPVYYEYDSLKSDPSSNPNPCERKRVVDEILHGEHEIDEKRRKNHTHDVLIEAKSWSKMIDQKIPRVLPKTPTSTPPGEPESIDVNELMEGLEGFNSPLRLGNHLKSFSFHVNGDSSSLIHENGLKRESQIQSCCVDNFPKNFVEKMSSNEKMTDTRIQLENEYPHSNGYYYVEKDINEEKKERVILFFTSLRGVRKTYEDCCYVRQTLKGLGICVDERDVSMHFGFKEELTELLGYDFKGGLPKIFVGKKNYIGGVEEIRRMNENSTLDKVFEGCLRLEEDDGNGNLIDGVCKFCSDIRFVPCETCSGSCKIYHEYEDGNEEYEDEENGFQRCPDCNENGLIRCPICCLSSC